MSNLWKLKEWLTLDEAADVLTEILGDSIKELDILRWAIAGKINLGLNFLAPFYARRFELKKTTENDLPVQYPRPFFEAPVYLISNTEHLKAASDEVEVFGSGIYRFAELGGIKRLLTKALMELLGNFDQAAKVDFGVVHGIFVTDSDGYYLQLLERVPSPIDAHKPMRPKNFYLTMFDNKPTICICPSDLLVFATSIAGCVTTDKKPAISAELSTTADLQIDEIVSKLASERSAKAHRYNRNRKASALAWFLESGMSKNDAAIQINATFKVTEGQARTWLKGDVGEKLEELRRGGANVIAPWCERGRTIGS